MSNWEKTFKDLGTLKVGSRKTIKFKMVNIVEVKEFKSSCGCSVPDFNKKTGELTVVYKVGSFPYHLQKQNSYQSVKWISVIYPNGVQEKLTFKSIVTR